MDKEYIKHQAQRARTTNSEPARENFLWRILSNSDEPGLSWDGSLSPEQKQKAQSIADRALRD